MIDIPVAKWLPIIPTNFEISNNKEKIVTEFIDKLIKEGVYEINFKDENGNKILLTFRHGHNTGHNKTAVTKAEFAKMPTFAIGFTSMIAFDLLQKDKDTSQNFKPIGNRDYRIVKFTDNQSIANGNFASKRSMLPTFKKPEYQQALDLADQQITEVSRGIHLAENIRGKKLGKFLMAVAIEVLSRSGVTQIDLSGSIEASLLPIAEKLGYSDENKKIKIDKIKELDYLDWILPFIT